MAEKPILFSTPMVQAILEGRKSQTRRVVKPQPESVYVLGKTISLVNDGLEFKAMMKDHSDKYIVPSYQPGDILWVRETWFEYKGKYYYRADGMHKNLDALFGGKSFFKWRPSIHMPREAARLFLQVRDVRVELLHDMTPDDVLAEGVNSFFEFAGIWDSINDKRGYGWDTNPYVWVVSFERQVPEGVKL